MELLGRGAVELRELVQVLDELEVQSGEGLPQLVLQVGLRVDLLWVNEVLETDLVVLAGLAA